MDATELARALVAHPRCPKVLAGALVRSGNCSIRLHAAEEGVVYKSGRDLVANYETPPTTRDRLPPRSDWVLFLSDPATAGLLVAALLAADPTASVVVDSRESETLMRVVVTGHDGTRRGFGGNVLGVVVAQGLLAVWGA